MKVNDIARRIHDTACSHGWHSSWTGAPAEIAAQIALIHSEASEALEEIRDGGAERIRADGKPEGLGSELADVIIRTLDLMMLLGMDPEHLIEIKAAYNDTRSHRHGGKVM